MRLTKIMLIEQSMKRNLQTSISRGSISYDMQFQTEAAKDKPWRQEISYAFAAYISAKDNKPGKKQKDQIFKCKGNYAIAFEKNMKDEDDGKIVPVDEATCLAWPFVRADINSMLAAAKLAIDLPYSLIRKQDGETQSS